MRPNDIDYKKLLSDLIQKLTIIFGPDITFARIKNIPQIKLNVDGSIEKTFGDNIIMLDRVVDKFMELSEFATDKAIQSLIPDYPLLAEKYGLK